MSNAYLFNENQIDQRERGESIKHSIDCLKTTTQVHLEINIFLCQSRCRECFIFIKISIQFLPYLILINLLTERITAT